MVGAERQRRAPRPSVAHELGVRLHRDEPRRRVGAVAGLGHQHPQPVERAGRAARDRRLGLVLALRTSRAASAVVADATRRVMPSSRSRRRHCANASGCERTMRMSSSAVPGPRPGSARPGSRSRRRSTAPSGTAGRASRRPAPTASSRSAARPPSRPTRSSHRRRPRTTAAAGARRPGRAARTPRSCASRAARDSRRRPSC